MFVIENEDFRELENIEPYIKLGGQIFFELDDSGKVIACWMIAHRDVEWEIIKFAARGMYTETGAGSACIEACINYGKEKKLPKIIIVSNRKRTNAIHLYRMFGFIAIPANKKISLFVRTDIAFEMKF